MPRFSLDVSLPSRRLLKKLLQEYTSRSFRTLFDLSLSRWRLKKTKACNISASVIEVTQDKSKDKINTSYKISSKSLCMIHWFKILFCFGSLYPQSFSSKAIPAPNYLKEDFLGWSWGILLLDLGRLPL